MTRLLLTVLVVIALAAAALAVAPSLKIKLKEHERYDAEYGIIYSIHDTPSELWMKRAVGASLLRKPQPAGREILQTLYARDNLTPWQVPGCKIRDFAELSCIYLKLPNGTEWCSYMKEGEGAKDVKTGDECTCACTQIEVCASRKKKDLKEDCRELPQCEGWTPAQGEDACKRIKKTQSLCHGGKDNCKTPPTTTTTATTGTPSTTTTTTTGGYSTPPSTTTTTGGPSTPPTTLPAPSTTGAPSTELPFTSER